MKAAVAGGVAVRRKLQRAWNGEHGLQKTAVKR